MCRPTMIQIGNYSGCCERQAKRIMGHLCALGLISKKTLQISYKKRVNVYKIAFFTNLSAIKSVSAKEPHRRQLKAPRHLVVAKARCPIKESTTQVNKTTSNKYSHPLTTVNTTVNTIGSQTVGERASETNREKKGFFVPAWNPMDGNATDYLSDIALPRNLADFIAKDAIGATLTIIGEEGNTQTENALRSRLRRVGRKSFVGEVSVLAKELLGLTFHGRNYNRKVSQIRSPGKVLLWRLKETEKILQNYCGHLDTPNKNMI